MRNAPENRGVSGARQNLIKFNGNQSAWGKRTRPRQSNDPASAASGTNTRARGDGLLAGFGIPVQAMARCSAVVFSVIYGACSLACRVWKGPMPKLPGLTLRLP